jgi:hypothetical protein
MKGIAVCIAYKGSQKCIYDRFQPIGGLITWDARPKIVDTPWMLTSMY